MRRRFVFATLAGLALADIDLATDHWAIAAASAQEVKPSVKTSGATKPATSAAPSRAAVKLAPVPKKGAESAMVFVVPCMPIEVLVGQFSGTMKPTANIIIDGRQVATVTTCRQISVPVPPGEHELKVRHTAALNLFNFPGAKFSVPPGGKIYFRVKIGNSADYDPVAPDVAHAMIAALPKGQ